MTRRKHKAPGNSAPAVQRFNQAQQLQQKGRLTEAESLYRELLVASPNAAGPMHFLGLLCMQRGDLVQAETLMAAALQQVRDPLFLSNFGMLCARTGRHDEAVELYQEAVGRRPSYAEAWFNLGVSRAEQGEGPQAIAAYRQAIALRPGYTKALFNLLALLHASGDDSEAEGIVQQLQRMGAASGQQGADLALALQRVGGARNPHRARELLTQSLERDPGDLEVALALARLLDEAAQHSEALRIYRALIERQPGRVDLELELAACLVRNGMLAEARLRVQQLPEGSRDNSAALVILGNISRFEGDFAAAMKNYDAALLQDSSCVGALHGIVQSRRFDNVDAEFAHQLSEAAGRKGSALLWFATGKVFDDMERYDEAFAAYEEANLRRSRSLSHDPAVFTNLVDAIIARFNAMDGDRLSAGGEVSSRPVFILGAPRSGTSLLEQMLVAHPAIARGGELAILGDLARNGCTPTAGSPQQTSPDRTRLLTEAKISAEAASYLAQTEMFCTPGQTLHVTDKMPTNFLYIGYLWMLFPRATVIHCRRHPVDTCLSIYFQSFNASYPFAFDLDHLAAWYRDYRRLMQFWDRKFPGRICHVDYHDAVNSPKETLTRVLTHIGMDWDPACDKFHLAPGPVLSASHWQVRQPVYSRSLDRWRHYQKHIPQLLSLVEGDSPGAPA
jgi:Flp pilus assembly protein TadD